MKVLVVGRVDSEKRVDRLIEIWSRLWPCFKEWKLQIVGSGALLEKVKEFSISKGVNNVEFVGNADVRKYYSNASIICLTSEVEGVPMVLREAMSYGIVPIVFNSFSAAHEMITNNVNGLLIPAFDMDAYTEGLSCLMRGISSEMRNAVFDAAKPYKGDMIFEKWKSLIEEVLQ